MPWGGGLSEAVGGQSGARLLPYICSSSGSRSNRRTGLWSSVLNSWGLVGPDPTAFVDIEWPVVRL